MPERPLQGAARQSASASGGEPANEAGAGARGRRRNAGRPEAHHRVENEPGPRNEDTLRGC
jgi:hypothetical protein